MIEQADFDKFQAQLPGHHVWIRVDEFGVEFNASFPYTIPGRGIKTTAPVSFSVPWRVPLSFEEVAVQLKAKFEKWLEKR